VVLITVGAGRGQWNASEEAELTATFPEAFDYFGNSVSIAGDTAVVGCHFDSNVGGTGAGSAFVFVRSGTTWSQEAKLTAADGAANDSFGFSVAISGDTIVIGSPVDDNQGGIDAGSAYVFVRGGRNWIQQAKLTASDGASSDFFGSSVSISGEAVLVGAYFDDHAGGTDAGSAYAFARSGTAWSEEAKLTAGDAAAGDWLGFSVSISGETALVGAHLDDHAGGTDSGSAYVFVRTGTTWNEEAKLTASDAAPVDAFGFSVSISCETSVVGAIWDDHAGTLGAGSAYVFVRKAGSWSEQARLSASDAADLDQFGTSVSVAGETAVVGATRDDHAGGIDAGSAYVFARAGTSWSEELKLTVTDDDEGEHFGVSVLLSGDTVVVGANLDDHSEQFDAGSAKVFRLSPAPPVAYCTAGTSASGCQALLSATGTASATASSGFILTASTVEGQKDGLFFFGTNGQQANSWGNGTSYQCVVPPVVRAGTLSGTGTVGACDGSFAQDLNALWCSSCPKPAKNPGAGAVVQAQLWYRDPLSTSNQTTSLSDAIELVVAP
jgi:hypothetical protein